MVQSRPRTTTHGYLLWLMRRASRKGDLETGRPFCVLGPQTVYLPHYNKCVTICAGRLPLKVGGEPSFFMPKILLIAPRSTGLVVEDEVQDILRSGLDVTPILGTVTLQEILDDSGEYDILWIAAHGGPDGVRLSGDQLWRTDELIDYAKDFALIVLNTCSSLEIAQGISNRWGAGVICTIADVGDRDAGRVAARFARALSTTGNPSDAYEYAFRGANQTYLYVGERRTMDNKQDLSAKIDELSRQVTKIEIMLNKDITLLASRVWLLERIVVGLIVLSLLESWLIIYWMRGIG